MGNVTVLGVCWVKLIFLQFGDFVGHSLIQSCFSTTIIIKHTKVFKVFGISRVTEMFDGTKTLYDAYFCLVKLK